MKPISAIRPAAVALAALTLGGCYYSSPYGYAPYNTPYYAPATVSQTPATPDNATTPPDVLATTVPVYPAPVYAPYPYPYYYPGGTTAAGRRSRSASDSAAGLAAATSIITTWAADIGVVNTGAAAATGTPVISAAGMGAEPRAVAARHPVTRCASARRRRMP